MRIDTNGQFDDMILSNPGLKKLDEITFSLDGHTAEINDMLRGKTVFEKCVSNIRKAVALGYKVHITCCVHKWNVGKGRDGKYLIEEMINFAEKLGVDTINFHPVLKVGASRDNWINNTDILPEQWLEIYSYIMGNIKNGVYSIAVRIPERFVSKEAFIQSEEYYSYCPIKLMERVLVHPLSNGRSYI